MSSKKFYLSFNPQLRFMGKFLKYLIAIDFVIAVLLLEVNSRNKIKMQNGVNSSLICGC